MPPKVARLSEAQVCGAHFSLESRGFLKDQVESALHTPGPSSSCSESWSLSFSVTVFDFFYLFLLSNLPDSPQMSPQMLKPSYLTKKTKGQLPCSSILPTVVILSWFSGGCKSSLCARYKLSYLHTWIYSSITIISKIHVVTMSHHDTVKKNLPNMLQGGSYSLSYTFWLGNASKLPSFVDK